MMPDANIKQLRDSSSTETRATERKTGWFPVTDLDKSVFIRRINARYSSGDDIAVTVYSDGDTDNSTFTGTLRANNGDTGMTVTHAVNSGSGWDSADGTVVSTGGTNVLKNGDWIKVDSEIVKVISAGANTHTVQRAMRGTTGAAHANTSTILYANYPNDSLRVGKRAKYAMVKLSSSASANDIEINRLEIEHK
jgi:hypothetical protein|tara:strand:+ start:568 stop:1149 length:582 start_codon:yes stop_codon:yes gene_type:complete